ncbi:hypothetical protein [Providencia sp. PROV116]|uniref:hypothetical protein n=1 Tax=Providencia sp. PROV116 TaxID=2949827 RepID=UPI003FA7A701
MVKQYLAEFKLEVAKMVVGHHYLVAKATQIMGVSLAGKLIKELGITNCQQVKHSYKRVNQEHVDITNLLDRQFAVTAPNQV